MLSKFETKSKRVKGLSFHKHRPWVLASLHNGSIHLFDYRAQVLLDKFEDHNGPVRGINFHETQPMFVSGGDDNHVKVWNYKLKKCLFTLQGHLDYVRTVEFHKELPWIISASDDQTVRLWNWQNRSIVAILTGHSHYVMCATFHPEDTLIASCSLDMTVRVWDFFKLKEKVMNKQGSRPGELFGGTEVDVKHILEGHEKGVNWVTFHPSMKIIASCADDKTIKLWRLSGNKHWEMDTLKGHTNNVSCVMFHPRMEVLISNSEDRTLRFWDMNRRVQIHQTRKDTDRYWILAAHPTLNYFGAGYDNGMNVFKLERERHASVRVSSSIFYVKNKNLYLYDLTTKNKSLVCPITTNGKQVLLNQPTQLYYNVFNQAANDFLLHFDIEGGSWLLLECDKDIRNGNARLTLEKKGDAAIASLFISKDRIAVLDSNREVTVGNFDGTNTKKWPILRKGMTKIDMIFPAPLGKILVLADDCLFMYDMAARKVMFELAVSEVKRVQWTPQFSHAVVITKNQVLVVNKQLQITNSLKEASKIKSGCFDEQNAFVYSTSTHIKYMFLEGQTTGTFKSIDDPIYVSFFMKNQIYGIDRNGEMQIIEVNNTDYLFKLALHRKNLQEVKEILGQGQLCGRSLITYLKEQGYSEIALFFEKDTKERFNLALSSGNIQVAFDAAQELKENEYFIKLAQTATSLGNYDITEKCLQQTRQFDKLNFFYAATGSHMKLERMQQVAGNLGDPILRYNTTLLTGDIQQRVQTLIAGGQLPLAYMSAKAHGLSEIAEQLEQKLSDDPQYDMMAIIDESEKFAARSKVCLPPRPINMEDGKSYFVQWPMVNLRAREAENAAAMFTRQKQMNQITNQGEDMFKNDNFGSSSVKESIIDTTKAPVVEAPKIDMGNDWGDDSDGIDLDDDLGAEDMGAGVGEAETGESSSDIFVPPQVGVDPIQEALRKNPMNAALNVSAGEFQKAMELLRNQVGVSNFAPLKQMFVDAYTLTKAKLQPLPHGPNLTISLKASPQMPLLPVTLSSIQQKFHKGIEAFTKKDLDNALKCFRNAIQSVTLLAISSAEEKKNVANVVIQIVEYITACRCEIERKALVAATAADPSLGPKNSVRIAELACYMTMCGLENAHKYHVMKSAMTTVYKIGNNVTAAHFARAIIDLEPTGIFAGMTPDPLVQIRQYYQSFTKKGTNAHQLAFNPADFVQIANLIPANYLCAGTLTCLQDNRSMATLKCALCSSVYEKQAYAGKVCETCELCKLGQDTLGLSIMVEAAKGAEQDANFAAAEFDF